ncbi:MAG: hydroxymethylbilane synthase [Thermomicrobiales bacterium]
MTLKQMDTLAHAPLSCLDQDSHSMALGNHIRIGARGSRLSLRQAELVRARLALAHPDREISITEITTTGDLTIDTPLPEIGGKGVFTLEIEEALRVGQIDLAVHSLKDLPTEPTPGIVIGAVPERVDVSDAVVSRSGVPVLELPAHAVIGTSSHRRAAQLLRMRPDFRPVSIRGNIETRIRKTMDPNGMYDAAVLASAGLERIGLLDAAIEQLPLDLMLPAPGQGRSGCNAVMTPNRLHCWRLSTISLLVWRPARNDRFSPGWAADAQRRSPVTVS